MPDHQPKLSVERWGIGPKIGIPALATGVLAAMPCWLWYEHVRIPVFHACLNVVGGVLLGLGMCVYAWSLLLLRRARRTATLATTGPFSWVRHPIYAAWILLILPAIGLLCGAWPMLLPAAVAYVGFRCHVVAEENRLRARFGLEYEHYIRHVPRIVPFLPVGLRHDRE